MNDVAEMMNRVDPEQVCLPVTRKCGCKEIRCGDPKAIAQLAKSNCGIHKTPNERKRQAAYDRYH